MHVVHSTVQLPGDLMGWWYMRHHAAALFNACVCLSSTPTIGVCAEDLRRADDATQHAGPVLTLQRKRTCFQFYLPAVFTLTSTTP
jgi:hypothetical protein